MLLLEALLFGLRGLNIQFQVIAQVEFEVFYRLVEVGSPSFGHVFNGL